MLSEQGPVSSRTKDIEWANEQLLGYAIKKIDRANEMNTNLPLYESGPYPPVARYVRAKIKSIEQRDQMPPWLANVFS